MKTKHILAGTAVAALLAGGLAPAALAADEIDCANLTAEQAADLEYAKLGIIDVPADLQKCVASTDTEAPKPGDVDTPTGDEGKAAEDKYLDDAEKAYEEAAQGGKWDTPTGDEGKAAEDKYLDDAEKAYNDLNKANEQWDTPTAEEGKKAEDDYLDAAEKEYNKLLEEQGKKDEGTQTEPGTVDEGTQTEEGAEVTEEATEAPAEEAATEAKAEESKDSGASLAKTGAAVGGLAGLAALLTGSGAFAVRRARRAA